MKYGGPLLSSPSWGPTNEKLALSVDGNLCIVNLNGDSLTPLTYSGQDFGCSWSNDGKTIAYTKTICDPDCGIEALDLSSHISRLVAQYGGSASWSPNSKTIYYYHNVFLAKPDPYPAEYAGFVLARIDITTFKIDSLFFVANPNLRFEDCAVSPDEQEILFSAAEAGPHSNIWKIDLSSHQMSQLTESGGQSPSYSPDGSTIVYSNTYISEGGLWRMDRNGANKKRLTTLRR